MIIKATPSSRIIIIKATPSSRMIIIKVTPSSRMIIIKVTPSSRMPFQVGQGDRARVACVVQELRNAGQACSYHGKSRLRHVFQRARGSADRSLGACRRRAPRATTDAEGQVREGIDR